MFYLSVGEIPMYNWNAIFSDGKVEYCYKNTPKTIDYEKVIDVCDVLMDDFISVFGINKKLKKYNELRKKSANLKFKYITTSNRMLVNEINYIDNQIDELKKLIFSQNTSDFDKNHVILQKWYGQRIDLKTTTVKEYYSIVEVYERANKENRHSRRGRPRQSD